MTVRWKLSKATFWNFWYYRFEEFIITNGKMNLRGANGSGKSVTTQSLITVLLDGNANPERLDPFGSRQRTFKDTVLGEVELLPNVIDRIGYITLELKKGNEVKTVGMGIKASRNKTNIETWYFILDGEIGQKDGQFSLSEKKMEDGKLIDSPLQLPTIREKIEKTGIGHVFLKRNQYAEAVNKEFFGFPTNEQYDELIKLLLQIRSPKLADQTKPEGLAEVLNNSLPELSPEELRDATETITSIDAIEKNLAKAKIQLSSLKSIRKAFLTYHERSLTEKAGEFIRAINELEKTLKDIENKKKQIENAEKKLITLYQDKIEIENELRTKIEEKELLSKDKSFDVANKRSEEVSVKQNLERELKELLPKKETVEKKSFEYGQTFLKATEKLQQAQLKLSMIIGELSSFGKNMYFDESVRFIKRFEEEKNDNESFDFGSWNSKLDIFSKFVQTVRLKLLSVQELKKDIERKEGEKTEYENTIYQLKDEVKSLASEREKLENDLAMEIDDWSKGLVTVSFNDETIESLFNGLSSVYIKFSETNFFTLIESEFNAFITQTKKNIYKIERVIEEIEEKISELKRELAIWKTDKEIEPFGLFSKKESFENLKKEGINFAVFYEAVEFKENLSEDEKKSLQNAISETGLLQSVIVEEKDVQKTSSFASVAVFSLKKEKNLTNFLKASNETSIPKIEIEKVLEGISVSKNDDTFILLTGEFQNGFIKGLSFEMEEGIFIGKAAREVMKKQKINDLTLEILSLTNEKKELQNQKDELEVEIVRSKNERSSFPSINELEGIYKKKMKEKEKITEFYQPKLDKVIIDLDRLRNKCVSIINEFNSEIKTKYDEFSISMERLEDVVLVEKTLGKYKESHTKLKLTYQDIQMEDRTAKSAEASKEEHEQRLREIAALIQETEGKIDLSERRILVYDEQLKVLDSNGIQKKIDELNAKINKELPVQRDETNNEIFDTKSKIDILTEQVEKLVEIEEPFKRIIAETWKRGFMEHNQFQFIENPEGEEDIKEIATFILKKHGQIYEKNLPDLVNRAKKKVFDVFITEKINVEEHNPRIETIEFLNIPIYLTDNEDKLAKIQHIKDRLDRIEILFDTPIKRGVSPFVATEEREDYIKGLEEQVDEKDKELYERILLNKLSESIKRKIDYVRKWEKKINNWMEHENNIKFRIEWVEKKKEREEEMDTKDLIAAINRDSQYGNMEKLVSHFRSKIKQAKKLFNDGKDKDGKENAKSLQEVIQEILDYRQWFEFKIYYTKKGEIEKPLNRKNYGKLSGGQRVLSMLTPVLASLHSKYTETDREDTLRLFTLDEAFARVDEENIEVLFHYIENLNFDYILNSQALWGCFESVTSLDIYELSRPDNRNFVSVIPYYWNGNNRIRKDKVGNDIE